MKEFWQNKRISLIGGPSDVGAGSRGGSMGPDALRVAGLPEALRRLGYTVLDKGNLFGPVNPEALPIHGYRHLKEALVWCESIRDTTYQSLEQGEIPVLLGGDHSLSIGSIAGVAKYCSEQKKKLMLLWMDAHADFNTPETSPSGNLHGMPLAVVSGLGHPDLLQLGKPWIAQALDQIILLGVRSVDLLEKALLSRANIVIFDMRMIDEHGIRTVMEKTLDIIKQDNIHLHVSFDVDFLDPEIAPGVATTVHGGPNYREAQLCMEMISDTKILGSLDIMELNPAYDTRNKTANLVVELVESLFGKQILARNPVH